MHWSASHLTAPFQGDIVGETNLNAANNTVNAVVAVDALVPGGFYTLAFVGYSGELERRVQVDIFIPQVYLPLIVQDLK